MKWRAIYGLLALSTVLALPQAALAGREFLFAESGLVPLGVTGCTKNFHTASPNQAYATMDGNSANPCIFMMTGPFPPDAPNSLAYKVHFETDDTTAATPHCDFVVQAQAFPDGGVMSLSALSATVTEPNRTHVLNARYIAGPSAATPVSFGAGPSACAGTCQNTSVVFTVTINPILSSSSKLCQVRMLEVIY